MRWIVAAVAVLGLLTVDPAEAGVRDQLPEEAWPAYDAAASEAEALCQAWIDARDEYGLPRGNYPPTDGYTTPPEREGLDTCAYTWNDALWPAYGNAQTKNCRRILGFNTCVATFTGGCHVWVSAGIGGCWL